MLTRLNLPDAIKWHAHNLLCLLHIAQIIWQTYQTLRITIALLERKNKHLDVFYLGEGQTTTSGTPCGFFNVPQSWDSKELWDGTSGLSLTAEYPSTPKEILKSVAAWLRRHAESRLSYRGHVEFENGYVATQKT